jgi:cytochrome P450
MHTFYPERWLVQGDGSASEKDGLVFDSTAGPTMPFSLGVRTCYGRRLGYLEMCIMVALLVFNFSYRTMLRWVKTLTSRSGLSLRCGPSAAR